MTASGKHIAIIASCQEDWGGSEELWAQAIPHFQAAGYNITVLKRNINREHQQFVQLARQGVSLKELLPARTIRLFKKAVRYVLRDKRHFSEGHWAKNKLRQIQPQFVLVSQGINFDGLELAQGCLQLKIPYAVIAQKAVDFYWPAPVNRNALRKVYEEAACSYFVSDHNRRLTEEQFGTRFPKSEIIYNTVKVPRQVIPMPDTAQGFRLACIGRYFLLDKGQDILIRIMAQPRWRNRPITISCIGSGNDKECLMEMAGLLGVNNIQFLDYTEDIVRIWEQYHALILPSSSEGLPLVLLEAMACGRTAIVSAAGGNPELITDGINGFVGEANEEAFDKAMERAWNAREEWEMIGKRAHAYIQEHVPLQPEKQFADGLLSVIAQQHLQNSRI